MEQYLEPSLVQPQLSSRHPLSADSLFIALQWKLAALAGRPEFEQAVAEAVAVGQPFCRPASTEKTPIDLSVFSSESTVSDFAKTIPANQLDKALRKCSEAALAQAQKEPAIADYIALARAIQDGPRLLARVAVQRAARKQQEKAFDEAAQRSPFSAPRSLH